MSSPAERDTAAVLEALAARVSAGDRAAEGELIERLYGGVLAIAVVRLRDRDAARDAAQDALVALLEALRAGRLREVEKVAAFAHGIVVNMVLNRRRKEWRRPRTEPLEPEHASAVPDDAVEAREEREVVRKGLRQLEAVDRRIVLMTLVQGLTPREIAPHLAMSAELVRTRKSRALKRLVDAVRTLTRPAASKHTNG